MAVGTLGELGEARPSVVGQRVEPDGEAAIAEIEFNWAECQPYLRVKEFS